MIQAEVPFKDGRKKSAKLIGLKITLVKYSIGRSMSHVIIPPESIN